ncbi:WD repeat, SAM and U-box domain-containing protein 1-like [Haliotis rubra]|uniref:WD repeat, SAM and U-box domain-containing protein 1-like n=1 Tax=Haliotis rubra TaxID=36100 RepID=UPI001EE5F216|nr:WD repeat, SAM and U-box domain-containing protein 1-like [Haliotis rubra]
MANMVASLIHTITSHGSDINCVAFTHDKLATCSGDKTVRIWSTEDFTELPSSPLLGHAYYVNCCVFSPFGNTLASCSTDGKLILWDVKTGDQVGVIQHPSKNGIRVCHFSPDSSQIVSGGDDNTLCLWEVSSRKLLKCFSGHDEMVAACAFTPDSYFVVSGSTDGHLRVWDAKFGHGRELAYELDGHDLGVTCCEFSPKYGSAGKASSHVANFLLATGGKDNMVKLWEFTGQIGSPVVLLKLRDTLPGHTDTVLAIAFSPNGDILASGSIDRTIRLWNPLQGTSMFTIDGHARYVTSCAFSFDGKMLASGSNDKTVMVWKLTDTSSIMAGLSGFEEPVKQTQPSTASNFVPMEKWGVEEVCAWITSLGLQQYQEVFRQQAIDGTELLALTAKDLEESMGVAALGHRNKILRSRTHVQERPIGQTVENDAGVPDEYLCPITREIMHDPVIAADGYTYDKSAIKSWIESGKDRSPMTNSLLPSNNLTPNRTLKMLIQRFVNGHSQG